MKTKTSKRLDSIKEYYFSRRGAEVKKLASQGKDIINLSIGSPDLAPPASVLQAASQAIFQEGIHGYQPHRGTDMLRSAWAGFYKTVYNVELDQDKHFLPLLGSKEGIFFLIRTFVNPGEKVLLPNPGYPAYSGAVRLNDAEAVYYSLRKENGFLPDFEELESLDLTDVKLMFVNYPNMPTGARANDEVYKKLIAFAAEKNILICHDNPYSLILNDNPVSIFNYEGGFENALELNSLSKTFNMAGWRSGILVGKEEIINSVLKVTSNTGSGMFYPVQAASAEALKMKKEWYAEINEVYKERKKLVFRLFDKLRLTYEKDTAGMFVWGELPEDITDPDKFLDDLLYNKGIYLTPGYIFGSNGARYIRASLCAPDNRILQAIERT